MGFFSRPATPEVEEELIEEVEIVGDTATYTLYAQVKSRVDTNLSRIVHVALPDKDGYPQRDIDISLRPTKDQWEIMTPGCQVKVTVEVTLPAQLGAPEETLALGE